MPFSFRERYMPPSSLQYQQQHANQPKKKKKQIPIPPIHDVLTYETDYQ